MSNSSAFVYDSDEDLVSAVKGGNEMAFRQLINQNQSLVVSIVYKMVARNEDREDLCQDIFLKVYEKLNVFGFRSKLSTWIGSIAFNTCVNFLQKRKSVLIDDLHTQGNDQDDSSTLSTLQAKDHGFTPAEKLEEKEQLLILTDSIERLTVIQKTVLQLFHHNDLSLQEISEITQLPVNTVKSHLVRARKRLKELIS